MDLSRSLITRFHSCQFLNLHFQELNAFSQELVFCFLFCHLHMDLKLDIEGATPIIEPIHLQR